jgi:hypothetical protein
MLGYRLNGTSLSNLNEALEDWLTVRYAGRGLSINTLRAYRSDIAAVAEKLDLQSPWCERRPKRARARTSGSPPATSGSALPPPLLL